jgi:hypothetical protein
MRFPLRLPWSGRFLSLRSLFRVGALGALFLAAAGPAASITGVCPDGSVFVVRSPEAVPCRGAKRVEPHRVPPLRPENLPRSYLWDVHREKIDQNNPYNLVDRADKVRTLGNADLLGEPPPPIGGGAGADGGPPPQAALPQVAAAPPATPPVSAPNAAPVLTDGEIRDLFYLVELSQRRAPATFLRPGKGGEDSLRVSLAHSQAFEARLRDSGASGSIVLFSVQPKVSEPFRPHFTFVQQGSTFTPRPEDPAQLGLLMGRTGDLSADELVLGYVSLPPSIDLSRPIDVYWDDRQLATTLRP